VLKRWLLVGFVVVFGIDETMKKKKWNGTIEMIES